MILVLDAGNTNIVLGVYDKDMLNSSLADGNRPSKTEDEYAHASKVFFCTC